MSTARTSEGKRPAETVVRVSELMTPNYVNLAGKVFGGTMLALVDKVAYVCAAKYAGTLCVTASFDRVDFHAPINVGELVHMVARVDFVGRTSIGVGIDVHAENVQTGEFRHTNNAYVTMVAMKDGKPTPVPPLLVETDEDKRRLLVGRYRRQTGAQQRQALEDLEKMVHEADSARLDDLVEHPGIPLL